MCREKVEMMSITMPKIINSVDTLPEWSKGVDSVGSNPTGVNCLKQSKQASEKKIERDGDSKTARDADRERDGDRG